MNKAQIYDEWTNCQAIPEFLRVSYGQDKHTSFRESVRFYVESMRAEWDRVSETEVTDAEAAEAVEAIIDVCRDYVATEGSELLAPIIGWVEK